MTLSIQTIIHGLKKVVDTAEDLAPLLAGIGLPGGTGAIITGALAVAKDVQAAIAAGQAIASATHQEQIDELISVLQAQADELAKEVDAS